MPDKRGLDNRGCTVSSSSLGIFDFLFQESEVMYTGPTAREMFKQHYAGRDVPDFDLDKCSVFVLCKIEENTEIQADSKILYQVCYY